MAKQSNSGLGGGWGGAVMNILFIVFSISVVFGVFLIAVVDVGNTISGLSYYCVGTPCTGANQISQTIGTTTATPYTTYQGLVSYLVTLAQFVGIIILLAIVGVLIYVLGSGVFGFLTGNGNGR